jgi:hypothetical protein
MISRLTGSPLANLETAVVDRPANLYKSVFFKPFWASNTKSGLYDMGILISFAKYYRKTLKNQEKTKNIEKFS